MMWVGVGGGIGVMKVVRVGEMLLREMGVVWVEEVGVGVRVVSVCMVFVRLFGGIVLEVFCVGIS